MDLKVLNSRKKEILDAQERMLNSATEAKRQLAADEETQFVAFTNELNAIDNNLTRYAAIEKGRAEVGAPRESAIITSTAAASQFIALGGRDKNVSADYAKNFYSALKSGEKSAFTSIMNASLGEGGSSAAGGALVPIETANNIPALAVPECTARGLSRVVTTEMNINLPYQASLSTAALKAESNSSGTNAFGGTAPTFGTTLLSAYMVGGNVTASWELLQDSKAAADFIPFDLKRAVVTAEENYFINGTGTGQPQGYIGNAKSAGTAALSLNNLMTATGVLNKQYYGNAQWLFNRADFIRLWQTQLAESQFLTFIQPTGKGQYTLLGYDVNFSSAVPQYAASPLTNGEVLFGDFKTFATIGDRGSSDIYVKVLDQIEALNAQTVLMGFRRTDQRILIQEAVVQLTING